MFLYFSDSIVVLSLGVMDIPTNRGDFIQVKTTENALPRNIKFTGLGYNSAQKIAVNTRGVRKICIFFVSEADVTDIMTCAQSEPSSTPPVAPSSSRAGSISGSVKEDIDGDDDVHELLSVVVVTLFSVDEVVIAPTLTDNSGNYTFSAVPGTYIVIQTNLPGYTDVTSNRLVVTVDAGVVSISNGFVDELPFSAPSISGLPSGAPVTPSPGMITARPTSPSTSSSVSVVNFDKFENGTNSTGGDYVKDEWLGSNGFSIDALSTCGGFTPNGKGRIFDSSSSGSIQKEEDPDLGSPNQMCAKAGPGQGFCSHLGQPGANCIPQGNVLIIQESDKDFPDDNNKGGILCFEFV